MINKLPMIYELRFSFLSSMQYVGKSVNNLVFEDYFQFGQLWGMLNRLVIDF